MKRFFLFVLFLTVALSAFAEERNLPIFVTTQWLADHLNEPDLVVLHVGFNRQEYAYGHIPGARFLWYNWLAISTPDASTEMPTIEQADTLLESFGITEKSTIVLYFGAQNVSTTTRMFLALSFFGFGDQTSMLDGGFEAWKKENRPIAKETPIVKKTSLTLTTNPSVLLDSDWLKANLTTPTVVIVDSRTKNFYDGNGGGIARQGHIRSAVNIPYTSLLDSSAKVLPVSRLQAIFDSAGVKRGTTVVSYCHVGQQATVVYAAALLLGYNAAVYDGSFEDWNVRGEEYPVEKPAPVQEHTSANSQGKKYSCPPCGSECDKPEYDKPGACPSCSMALIEKKL